MSVGGECLCVVCVFVVDFLVGRFFLVVLLRSMCNKC